MFLIQEIISNELHIDLGYLSPGDFTSNYKTRVTFMQLQLNISVFTIAIGLLINVLMAIRNFRKCNRNRNNILLYKIKLKDKQF